MGKIDKRTKEGRKAALLAELGIAPTAPTETAPPVGSKYGDLFAKYFAQGLSVEESRAMAQRELSGPAQQTSAQQTSAQQTSATVERVPDLPNFGVAVIIGGKVMGAVPFHKRDDDSDDGDILRFIGDDKYGMGKLSYVKVAGWNIGLSRSVRAFRIKPKS